jgi:hypothetical protein
MMFSTSADHCPDVKQNPLPAMTSRTCSIPVTISPSEATISAADGPFQAWGGVLAQERG